MGKAWIQGLLEHGKEICSSFKSNEVIKIKSNRKSRNKSAKFSKKESSEIQGVTNLPPLEKISSSRFGCSGNHCKLTVLRQLAASRIFFLTAYCCYSSNPIYLLRGFTSPGP